MDAARDRSRLRAEFGGQELDGAFVERANAFQSPRSEREQQLLDGGELRWSRIFAASLRFLSKLHRIDILADEQLERASLRTLLGVDHHHLRSSGDGGEPSGAPTKRPVYWPLVVFYAILLLLIRLAIRTYFLYYYDLTMLRYKHHKQQQRQRGGPANSSSLDDDHDDQDDDETSLYYANEFRRLEWVLRLAGSVTLESRFFVGIFNVYIGLMVGLAFVVAPCVFRFVVRINFPLGKRLLDLRLERQAFVRLACREANSFVGSMRNFNRISLEELKFAQSGKLHRLAQKRAAVERQAHLCSSQVHSSSPSPTRNAGLLDELGLRAEMLRIRREQRFLVDALRGFVFTGALETANWRPQTIERLASRFGLLLVAIAANVLCALGSLPLYLPILLDTRLIGAGPLAALNGLENALLLLAAVLGLLYFISIVLVSVLDLIEHVRELARLLAACVAANELQLVLEHQSLRPPLDSPAGDDQRCRCRRRRDLALGRRLNARLLHAYLHYKIYAATFRSVGPLIGVFLGLGFGLQLVLPLLTVAHESYLNESAKRFYTMICLCNLLFLNSILLPVCYLRARSTHLYRSLGGLLAHTIRHQQQQQHHHHGRRRQADCGAPDQPQQPVVEYDPHLGWSLRKELADSRMMLAQFTARVWGLTIDYANLLRLHFWFGLIMLTMLSGRSTRGDLLLADLFHDPYGLL